MTTPQPEALLNEIEHSIAVLGERVGALAERFSVLRTLIGQYGPYGHDEQFDVMPETVRATAAATNRNADQLFDTLDRARRTRPNWIQRGIVFAAIARQGGSVPVDAFEDIVVHKAGYSDVRAVNPFFRGEPQPVLERHGEAVRLTLRGKSAAAFFNRYWLPRLLDGKINWPNDDAEQLFT